MNKLIGSIISSIFAVIILYLGFSFVYVDFNPAMWTFDARALFVMTSIFSIGVATFINFAPEV